MAYDEDLAARIRRALAQQPDVIEKRMFGGIAFLVQGRMSVGVIEDRLIVRVGAESYDRVLRQPHVQAMDFTGRPMKGFVYVVPAGCRADEELERWVDRGVGCATGLPAKPVRMEAVRPGKPRPPKLRTARRA